MAAIQVHKKKIQLLKVKKKKEEEYLCRCDKGAEILPGDTSGGGLALWGIRGRAAELMKHCLIAAETEEEKDVKGLVLHI